MLDPTSLSGALASLRVLLDLAKGANNAQISAAVVTAVIDIQSKLLNVQDQALELQNENRRLQLELEDLKESSRVLFEGSARWEHLNDGTVDGPR
jgi:hypothetical protein